MLDWLNTLLVLQKATLVTLNASLGRLNASKMCLKGSYWVKCFTVAEKYIEERKNASLLRNMAPQVRKFASLAAEE